MAHACVLTEYGPPDVLKWDVKEIFPLPEPPVLGFETAGTVDAVGEEAAAAWTPKPPQVTWNDAGALPSSVEAAVGVLRQLGVADGETVLILANKRGVTDRIDATFDAAGKGGLEDAIALTGGTDRVITLADPRAPGLGVRFSVGTPDRAPDAVDIGMELVASGELRLRPQRSLPMSQAAEAHRLLENGHAREKVVLVTEFEKGT
jgi:NADPH:quinone reductase-like Zn-dependent oxidoreductase